LLSNDKAHLVPPGGRVCCLVPVDMLHVSPGLSYRAVDFQNPAKVTINPHS
jgi:hypothetical protein